MRQARARRRRSQAIECAPLAGASGAVTVSAGLAGWMVAGPSAGVLASTGTALLTAAMLAIPNALRRRVRLRRPESVAVALGALAVVASLAGAWQTGVPVHPALLAVLSIGGASLWGAATGWAWPTEPDQTLARELDRRARLAESLATACHLAGHAPGTDPWQEPMVQNALARARRSGVDRLSLRRRGPGTWAVLAGSAGAALAVALLASTAMPGRDDPADLLARLNQPQRSEFIAFLRQQRQAKPALAAPINDAITAIEVDDPDKLAEVLDRLRRAGFDVRTELPEPLRTQLAGETPAGGGDAGGDSQGNPPIASTQPRDPEGLTVWTPPTRTDGQGEGTSDEPTRTPVDYQDAWQVARSEAMERLQAGQVPPHRRELIRRYFQPDPAD